MSNHPPRFQAAIGRRAATKLLLAVPAAAVASAAQDKPAKVEVSPLAACLAENEPGLSAEEKARLQRNLGSLEQGLKVIREFKMPPGTEPSLTFRAMKSTR